MTICRVSSVVLALCAIAACGHDPGRAVTATSEDGTIRHLGLADAANATPVLASSGRWVVVAWTATKDAHTDVYAATSDDGGARFGATVRVNDIEGEAHVYGEDPPRVALGPVDAQAPDRAPAIVVTWPSDRGKKLGLRSARSLDGGRTFSSSISIGDVDIAGERGFQSIAIGGDGVARAAWLDGRRDPGTPRHANAGGDWDPMHLMYASTDSDGRWQTERRLASVVCGCCKTAVAIGRDGAVYVAWRNIYPGDLRDISMAVARDGQTFSKPVRVSEDHWVINACPDDGPTIALDPSGVVHIVWPTFVDGPVPAMRFFHASTRDGITFTPREAIPTLGSQKPAHPQMVWGDCGSLALVWDEARNNGHVVAMTHLTPLASGTIQSGDATILSADAAGVYPVVARTPAGLLVAWTEVSKSGDRSTIALRRLDSVTPGVKCQGQ